MGSGPGGSYSESSSSWKSQDYAASYSVVSTEYDKDIKNSYVYNKNTGYYKNPTTTNINDAIKNNNVYFEGHKANGKYTYALKTNGELVFAKRASKDRGKRSPHPSLIGGKNPTVKMAGMIDIRNGKIYDVNADSGHYRPNIKSLSKVENMLYNTYGNNIFAKKSRLRRKRNDG